MPPLSSTQTPEPILKPTALLSPSRPNNKQNTPPIMQQTRVKKVKMEPEAAPDLAPVFKEDLTNLRSLVTCSICDQLLYEPFTIQCGHTYCYSCLCSWFVPNKRKKTCPECRTIIKQMPAPSFMIKQMVEVFVNRAELMPADESPEQHAAKRAEEIAIVEKDRNGHDGLFKGLFPPGRVDLILDEADRVHRCPHCHTEYTGGPSCDACGAEIDGDDLYDFSDDDLDDLDEIEEAMREELEEEIRANHGRHHHLGGGFHFQFSNIHQAHLPHHHDQSSSIMSGESQDDNEDDEGSLDDSEDEGSLRDFISEDGSPEIRQRHVHRHLRNQRAEATPHAESPRRVIDISDDDSDEGGPIINRNRRNRSSRQISTPPRVINLTEDDSSASDAGDIDSVAERLRYDGWSPLHEADNDNNEFDERGAPISDNGSEDESDTETIGNDEGGSPRARIGRPGFQLRMGRRFGRELESDADDDGSDEGTNLDIDGDTEMSLSPDARASRLVRYDDYSESEAETNYDQHPYFDPNSMGTGDLDDMEEFEEDLGDGHHLQGADEDASDGWPSDTPPRRQARALIHHQAEEGYDPRISQIFAHHQDSMMREGSQRNPISLEGGDSASHDLDYFEGLEFNHDHTIRQAANSSRTRRSARAYRGQDNRSHSARRRTMSPAASRIISSSVRPSQVSRTYLDHGEIRHH